jgi:hypothetical protein
VWKHNRKPSTQHRLSTAADLSPVKWNLRWALISLTRLFVSFARGFADSSKEVTSGITLPIACVCMCVCARKFHFLQLLHLLQLGIGSPKCQVSALMTK